MKKLDYYLAIFRPKKYFEFTRPMGVDLYAENENLYFQEGMDTYFCPNSLLFKVNVSGEGDGSIIMTTQGDPAVREFKVLPKPINYVLKVPVRGSIRINVDGEVINPVVKLLLVRGLR